MEFPFACLGRYLPTCLLSPFLERMLQSHLLHYTCSHPFKLNLNLRLILTHRKDSNRSLRSIYGQLHNTSCWRQDTIFIGDHIVAPWTTYRIGKKRKNRTNRRFRSDPLAAYRTPQFAPRCSQAIKTCLRAGYHDA
jgi:hypothetical protein